MRTSKIVSVKKIGYKNTFDITVKNNHHLFFANGIATSNSHGVSYGTVGYWTAYVKAHFPLHFYTSWLYYANEKMDPQKEMQLLISDARYFEIPIKPPSLQKLFCGDLGHFALDDNTIYFGMCDIKKIGQALVEKTVNHVRETEKRIKKPISEWNWKEFLIYFSDKITTTVVNNIIHAGATDYMSGNRLEKVHEYNIWRKLTQKERDFIAENCDINQNMENMLQYLINNKKRLSEPRKKKISDLIINLKKPSYSLKDTPLSIAQHESELLGVPITCTKLDVCDSNLISDTKCKEFLQGKYGNMTIMVEISEAKEYIIKKGKLKGQKMMFLEVEDDTGALDNVVIFPSTLEGNEPILINGNTVLLKGKRESTKDSFIVEKIQQI